jgi:ArsR family transcriptional regulator
MPAAALLLDSLSALADPTRCRILLLLESHELTVSELCAVVQLPQSTVSRHLKTLSDVGLVASRRDGTSRYYSIAADARQDEAVGGRTETPARAQLWRLARRELADRPTASQDDRRLLRVLARRSEASQQFFATSAGRWDRLRDDLFGHDFYWRALVALLPDTWVVGDLGCGTGAIVSALAPHVARVIGVDASEEMLRAAAARLGLDASGAAAGVAPAHGSNVELRRGVLEALPLDAAVLDAATLVLVLHHLPTPASALAEAFRVLRPGGRLLIVDMAPHDREEYRHEMGHVWLGFSDDQLRRLLAGAGFDAIRVHALPPVTEANGPALFVATATRPALPAGRASIEDQDFASLLEKE